MDKQYLSQKAAAEYLTACGVDVLPETLARWRSNGRYPLPFVKVGKIVRYARSDLDQFIESHRVVPGESA